MAPHTGRDSIMSMHLTVLTGATVSPYECYLIESPSLPTRWNLPMLQTGKLMHRRVETSPGLHRGCYWVPSFVHPLGALSVWLDSAVGPQVDRCESISPSSSCLNIPPRFLQECSPKLQQKAFHSGPCHLTVPCPCALKMAMPCPNGHLRVRGTV